MAALKPHILDAIYRHALAEYPSECCGMIIGKKKTNVGAGSPRPSNAGWETPAKNCGEARHAVWRQPLQLDHVFPCRNLQDDMHQKNPEQFPRSSRNAYFLDPKDLFKIQKISRDRGLEIKIIYHSHIDSEAFFSEEDKKQALCEGNPIYPGVCYLVVDVTKNKVRRAKLFGWMSDKKDFLELIS